MLKMSLIEICLRGIPEAVIYIFASYIYFNIRVNKRRLCISSVLLALFGYFIRLMPIHFGVHTILYLISHILLCVCVNKINIIKAIYSALISMIILFICEGINIFILENILNVKIEVAFSNPLMKILYGTPSIILFAIAIFVFYKKIYENREVNNNVVNIENR